MPNIEYLYLKTIYTYSHTQYQYRCKYQSLYLSLCLSISNSTNIYLSLYLYLDLYLYVSVCPFTLYTRAMTLWPWRYHVPADGWFIPSAARQMQNATPNSMDAWKLALTAALPSPGSRWASRAHGKERLDRLNSQDWSESRHLLCDWWFPWIYNGYTLW